VSPVTIVLMVILAAVILLFVLANKQYKEFIEENKNDFQLLFMAPAALYLIDRFRVMERSSKIHVLIQKVARVYGAQNAISNTKMFLAQNISIVLTCLVVFSFLAVANGNDSGMLIFGVFLAVILPIILTRKLDEKIEKKKQDILIELPEFTNKIILLVNAGETVQRAIVRCVEQKEDIEKSPLYTELQDVVNRLHNNEPMNLVLEEFSKRCGIQEISIFTTTVLLNYRRGGTDFVTALRELSRDLWEKRKSISKIRGEEASSKLVFPMVAIFLVVMVIIGWPAMKLFNM
jgi:tight adherence protein C